MHFRFPLSEVISENEVPKEAEILEALNTPGHPNITKYYGWGKIEREEMINSNKEHLCCFPEGTYLLYHLLSYLFKCRYWMLFGVGIDKWDYFGVEDRE